MILLGSALITILMLLKFKPSYKVIISGEEVGYIDNKQAFKEELTTTIKDTNEKQENVDSIIYNSEPQFQLNLINRNEDTNENKMLEEIENNVDITYKYYEIAISHIPVDAVNTLEDAQTLVNEVQAEENGKIQNLDLSIVEKYTNNSEEVKTNEVQVAKNNITHKIDEQIISEQERIQKEKEEQERLNAMPVINGIRLASVPVSGTISSRFGVRSSLRRSTHTGLDIACSQGTPIKVTADGTVISAAQAGAYGNLVKVSHGNGLETWYAHTSKMFVKAGQPVKAGDVIAAVGTTGNSTGPHLHLEIRINGQAVNPQQYLYN